MKIFINNVNTYSGNCLCETFDEVRKKKTEIYGTVVEEENEEVEDDGKIRYYFENVKKVISRIPIDNIVKYILKCQLVIYDLNNTNIEELEYVIHKLKYEKLKHKITFILISSVMVWNKTKRRFVPLREEDDSFIVFQNKSEIGNDNLLHENRSSERTESIRNEKGKEKKKIGQEKQEQKQKQKQKEKEKEKEKEKQKQSKDSEKTNEKNIVSIEAPEIFNANNYLQRTCSNNYESFKSLETLILSLNSSKNIKAYVVASGITYGNGENTFFPIFKNAWLGKDNYIIEKGDNYIPVIHIKGLCEYVKDLYISNSKKKYFIAVDNEFVTQKKIVETVAECISDNKNYINISLQNSLTFENTETLCVNLRFQCTSFVDSDKKQKNRRKGKGKKKGKDNENEKEKEKEKRKKQSKKQKKQRKSKEDSEEENEDSDNENETSGDDTGDSDQEEEKEEEEEDEDEDEEDEEEEEEEESDEEDENIDEDDEDSDNESEENNSDETVERIETETETETENKEKKRKKKKNKRNADKENKNKKSLVKFYGSDGFTKNIEYVAKEFCQCRNLKRLKILILGQPGSGKTFIAKQICEHYNLILCSIDLLIEEFKKKNYNFPDYYKKYLETSLKKGNLDKEKGKYKEKEKDEVVEREKGKLKLIDLSLLFYKKLESNGCKFRGFILDYFPRNYEEAKYFFEDFYATQEANKKKQIELQLKKNKKKTKKYSSDRSHEKEEEEEEEADTKEKEEEEEENDKEIKKEKKKREKKKSASASEESDSLQTDEKGKEKEKEKERKKEGKKGSSLSDEGVEDSCEEYGTDVDKSEDEEAEDKDEDDNENENADESNEEKNKIKIKKKRGKNKKEKKKKFLNDFLLPEYVIILKATEEICRKRMMEINEEEIIKGHNDEAGFQRRYNKYVEENMQDDYFENEGKKTVEDYFVENGIEVFSVHINEDTLTEDILTNIRIFIENKRFYNFLESTEVRLKRELEEREELLRKEKENNRKLDVEIIRREMEENEKFLKEEKKRQQLLLEDEQKYIENQSLPLRFYLIKNILPILTDSLIHVCKTKPKNPCLHIADYLLKNAHKYDVDESDSKNPSKDS